MFDNSVNKLFKLCSNASTPIFAINDEEKVILKMSGIKLQRQFEI